MVIKMPPVPSDQNTVAMALRSMLGNYGLVSNSLPSSLHPFQAQSGAD